MIFDSYNPLDWARLLARFKQLYAEGLKRRIIIELTEKIIRTPSQNNYIHFLCRYFGSQAGLSADYVKRYIFKYTVNPDVFIIGTETDPWTGHETPKLRSSASLTKSEFSLCTERFLNWSADTAGILLPRPEDKDFIKECMVEIEKNKQFL